MKKIKTIVKLQIEAGKANPAPPIGPVLGQHGVSIQGFCSSFNEKTKDRLDEVVPVELTIYEDASFDMRLKTPPASDMLKKAAGVKKGSPDPFRKKVGKVSRKQIVEIAEKKMVDLNTKRLEAAAKIIEGSARSMGIEVIR